MKHKSHIPYYILHTTPQKGFTLVEAITYVAILTIVLLVVIEILITMATSYRALWVSREVQATAGAVLDRIAVETRSAESVDSLGSVFGVHPGALRLNTTDAGGNPTTVLFFLSGLTLRVKEGGVDKGSITGSTTKVTNLIFRRLIASTSEAIRTEITLEATYGGRVKSEQFYLTNVLRGSYKND